MSILTLLNCYPTQFKTLSYIYFRKKSKNSEDDQEIPQLQTADKPMAPRGRAT